jgi:endoglucanase
VKRNTYITFAIIALTVVVMIAIYFGVRSGKISEPQNQYGTPTVFSGNRMLLELWGDYKQNILEPGSLRALDKSQNNITTSEGQSYTLMRAVWMDDRDTFDKAWKWTKDNMQRDDKLLSWRFGEKPDGSFGIQDDRGGQNTASDGDVDIAYALIMASNRWKEDDYLYDAKTMIDSIWEKEVVDINGELLLASNDIERNNQESILVNPSYFAPYAYRVFAKVDPTRDWNGLVDGSYSLLFAATDSALDTQTSAGLTPNWVRVDRATGQVSPEPTLDANYGYDAFRTPWRLTLDYRYNKDVRALQVLNKHKTLSEDWQKRGRLASVYGHNGKIVTDDSVPAQYGASLGYYILTNPAQAKEIYDRKLLTNYDPDVQGWKKELSYYDDNWAWFGMALYLKQLPDIAGMYES